MDNVRGPIRSFILENLLPGEDAANLKDDMGLKENGILDSMSTLTLVAFLEERFDIELEAGDLDPGNLATVADIERLVKSKLASE